MKPVKVRWIDSMSSGGWQSKGDWKPANMEVVSVGFLFKDLDDRIVLCQGETEFGIGEVMEIPKFAITSMRYLK